MSIPNGTGKENTGNKVTNTKKSDIDKLLENVINTIGAEGKFSGTDKSAPSASDLKGKSHTITEIVPLGFLLLHDDLTKLIKANTANAKGGNSTANAAIKGLAGLGSSLLTMIGPLMLAVGGAAIVGTIISGIFKGNKEDDNSKLSEVVSELNNNVTASDMASKPEIIAVRDKAFAAYVGAYYGQMIASMAISGVLEGVGEGLGGAVRGFFTALAGKEEAEPDITATKLQEIVNILSSTIDASSYEYSKLSNEHPLVKVAVDTAIGAYLVAYFTAQGTKAVSSDVGEALGEGVGGILVGLGKSLGIVDKEETTSTFTTTMNAIIENIVSNIDAESYKDPSAHPVVWKEVDVAIGAYLLAYFASSATKAATTGVGEAIGEGVGGILVGLGKSLGIVKKEETESTYTQTMGAIINTIMSNIDVESYASADAHPVVWKEVDVAIGAYLAAYFAGQTAKVVSKEVGEAIGEGVVSVGIGAVKGLGKAFLNIFGAGKSPLEKITDVVMDELGKHAEDYRSRENHPIIWKEVDAAVGAYVAVYLTSLVAKDSVKQVAESGAEAGGGGIIAVGKGFFKGIGKGLASIVGKEEKDPLEKITEVIMTELGNNADDYAIRENHPIIWKEVDAAVGAYVATFFASQVAKVAVVEAGDSVGQGLSSVVTGFFGGIIKSFLNIFGVGMNPLEKITAAIMNKLGENAEDYTVRENYPRIWKNVDRAVESYISTFFESQSVFYNDTQPVKFEISDRASNELQVLQEDAYINIAKIIIQKETENIVNSYSSSNPQLASVAQGFKSKMAQSLATGFSSFLKESGVDTSENFSASSDIDTDGSALRNAVVEQTELIRNKLNALIELITERSSSSNGFVDNSTNIINRTSDSFRDRLRAFKTATL